jgi:hypothetical protein
MRLTNGTAVHVVLGIYHRVPWTIATVALGAAVETIGVSMINRSVTRTGASDGDSGVAASGRPTRRFGIPTKVASGTTMIKASSCSEPLSASCWFLQCSVVESTFCRRL